MNLNLGLEALNVPRTAPSALEMARLDHAIDVATYTVENLANSYCNAIEVAKAVKRYGRTQSMIALVGAESIDAAVSFEADEQAKTGLWQKIKDWLAKAWEAIKAWWGKLIGWFTNSAMRQLDALEKKVNDDAFMKTVHFPISGEFFTPEYYKMHQQMGEATLKAVTTGEIDTNGIDKTGMAHPKQFTCSNASSVKTIVGAIRGYLEWAVKHKDDITKAINTAIDEIKKSDLSKSSPDEAKKKIQSLKDKQSKMKTNIKDVVTKVVAQIKALSATLKVSSELSGALHGGK